MREGAGEIKSSKISFLIRYGPFLYWATVLAIASATILSRLLFNGYIFDFDYHLYQPDGALYTYQALRWSGVEPNLAAQRVIDWYQLHGEDGTNFSLASFDPKTNPAPWGLVNARFLYSLLSLPFVAAFGINGMLVVPVASMLVLFLTIARIAWQHKVPVLGIVLVLTISTSLTLSRWFVVNYTDSLLAGLFLLLLLFIDKLDQKVIPRKILALTSILIFLTSITRFCLPYWLALAAVLFLRRKRFAAFFISALSILGLLPVFLARPDLNAAVVGQEDGVLEKLIYLPWSAIKILFIESAQLIAMDRSLFAILAVAMVTAILNIKKFSSQVFIAFAIAGWGIGVINGVLGVNFRYQLPVLAIACWVILDSVRLELRIKDATTRS